MRTLLRTTAFIFLALIVTQAHALEKFDFEQKFFVEFGPEVKDHALLRVDGVYHLFYLRGNPAVDIGHAISTDLAHWEILPPVLYVEPGTWDDKALWAPQVKPLENGYVMYYTGVNLAIAQQAGIAFSNDLNNWYKLQGPVYHPDQSWALWDVNTFSHGRDPFVFEYNGRQYMLNTAKTPYNKGAISLASSDDGFNWTDEGPLYVHDTWHVMESVQMIERNGEYHIFFTEEAVYGTSWASNTSGDPLSGWDLTNAAVIDFGHAPEVNEIDPGIYTFSRHYTYPMPDGSTQFVLRFDELKWSATYPYVDKPWPLKPDWTNVSGSAFIFAPTFLNNPAARGESIEVGYQGLSWVSSYEQYQGPLGIGSVGGYQGEAAVGVMHSRTFTITGKSINLLVGGSDMPEACYVALRDANTDDVLASVTGHGSDELQPHQWDVRDWIGQQVYLEVADNSTEGHICVDNIEESYAMVGTPAKPKKKGSDGRGSPHRASGSELPAEIVLNQNSPNPFNPSTTISYGLPADADVSIDIYNVNGQRVRSLVTGRQTAGVHSEVWNGRNDAGVQAPSGIYFYRLAVDGRQVATRKMILLK